MTLIVSNLTEQPVPELRYGALDLLGASASRPSGWGIRALFGYPGFLDFLTDR